MSDLDIAEKRRPQDGKLVFGVPGKNIDVRVSVSTTQSISPETINGQWSVLYDKKTLSAYHNGLQMLSFYLPTNQQLTTGEYCSFYTNNASVLIDNFVVYKSPTITVSFTDGINRIIQNQKYENDQAISSYDYDAWGNPMNSTVSEESAYRYTGREYDDETGLHNFRARLYDSTLMRFYQVDPAEQFASPYVYCGNNPITLIDPDGRNAEYFPEGYYVSEDDVSNSVNAITQSFSDTNIPISASDGKFSLANPELTKANIHYLTPDQSLFYDMMTNPNFTLRVGVTNGLIGSIGFQNEPYRITLVKADQYVDNKYNRRTQQQTATGNVHVNSMQVASILSGEPLDQVFMHFANECYEYSRAHPNRRWSRDEYQNIHNQILTLQTNTSAHKLQFRELYRQDQGTKPYIIYRWYDPDSDKYSDPIRAQLRSK